MRAALLLLAAHVVLTGWTAGEEIQFEIVRLESLTGRPERIVAFNSQTPVALAVGPERRVAIVEQDRSVRRCVYLKAADRVSLGPAQNASWSPAGSRLVVSRLSPEPGVWLISVGGGSERLLDRRGRLAVWSQDGRALAWAREVDGRPNVVIYDLFEADYDVLWSTPVSEFASVVPVAWGPLGKQLLLAGAGEDGKLRVFVASADGSRSLGPELSLAGSKPETVSGGWLKGGHAVVLVRKAGQSRLFQLNDSKWQPLSQLESLIPISIACRPDGLYVLRQADE